MAGIEPANPVPLSSGQDETRADIEIADITNTLENEGVGDTQAMPDLEEPFLNSDTPLVVIAVLFKEAALDSPTFRSSLNHLNLQFEHVDRWLESFIRSTQKLSQEMEGNVFV